MEIENRIIKTELIEWRKIKPLQPENAKIIFNYKDIEKSILKYGFAQPFYVWEHKKELFTIDGHTRLEVLTNMEDVPDKLPATFINAKDRKEAIEILLDVFNQKHNPFDYEILEEFIEVENVEVNVESLNVKVEHKYDNDIDLDSFFEEDTTEKENKFKITLEYTEEDYNAVQEALKNHSGSKEQIFFKLLGL